MRLMPFFYRWKDVAGAPYPDGQGMFYQPSMLVDAFGYMAAAAAAGEKREFEKEKRNRDAQWQTKKLK